MKALITKKVWLFRPYKIKRFNIGQYTLLMQTNPFNPNGEQWLVVQDDDGVTYGRPKSTWSKWERKLIVFCSKEIGS